MKNSSKRSPGRAVTNPVPPDSQKRHDFTLGGLERVELRPTDSREARQYERIFHELPLPAWIVDRATLRFLAVNDACVTHFGFSPQAFLGMVYTDLHRPEDVLDVRQRLGQHAPSQGIHTWRQRKSSGEFLRIQVSWRPVAFDRVPAILMVAHPAGNVQHFLEEAETSRARLEALSWRLVKVQEAERSALSRELHDEIGQLLTGLKLLIASTPAATSGGEQGSEMLQIVNELIGRVRDLSMDLRPPMLEEIGLIATLEWYFERYTARTRIQVLLEQDVLRTRFQDAIEIAAFRIIQEALTNVARHAAVDVVQVDLRVDPEGLRIVVEDQGQGFDPGTVRSAGITGMHERAHLVGGHLTLESSSGSGTRVVVVLPLLAYEEGSQDLDL